jgi:hypothetical protein
MMERLFWDEGKGLKVVRSMDGDDDILLCCTIIHCEKEGIKRKLLFKSNE